jgi:hypothetical protein
MLFCYTVLFTKNNLPQLFPANKLPVYLTPAIVFNNKAAYKNLLP